jgi:YVTN family beta-propeller protein
MNARMSRLFAIVAFVALGLLASGPGYAQNAYITNQNSNSVSVIATATNTVTINIDAAANLTIEDSLRGPPAIRCPPPQHGADHGRRNTAPIKQANAVEPTTAGRSGRPLTQAPTGR